MNLNILGKRLLDLVRKVPQENASADGRDWASSAQDILERSFIKRTFASLAERDSFYSDPDNLVGLLYGDVILITDTNTPYFWSGESNPDSYDSTLFRTFAISPTNDGLATMSELADLFNDVSDVTSSADGDSQSLSFSRVSNADRLLDITSLYNPPLVGNIILDGRWKDIYIPFESDVRNIIRVSFGILAPRNINSLSIRARRASGGIVEAEGEIMVADSIINSNAINKEATINLAAPSDTPAPLNDILELTFTITDVFNIIRTYNKSYKLFDADSGRPQLFYYIGGEMEVISMSNPYYLGVPFSPPQHDDYSHIYLATVAEIRSILIDDIDLCGIFNDAVVESISGTDYNVYRSKDPLSSFETSRVIVN